MGVAKVPKFIWKTAVAVSLGRIPVLYAFARSVVVVPIDSALVYADDDSLGSLPSVV